MKVFKNIIIKLLVGLLLVFFGVGNSWAGFTVVANAGTLMCSVEGVSELDCNNDDECRVRKEFCSATINSLGGVVESTVIKEILKFGGDATVRLTKKAVKLGLGTRHEVSNQIVMRMGHHLRTNVGVQKIKGFSASEVGMFFIEMAFDVSVELFIRDLPNSALNPIRNSGIPGFKNASPDAIKQGMKWMFTVAKNDAKFIYYNAKRDYVNAISAGVIDNGLVLAEISIGVLDSGVELMDSRVSAAESENYSNIIGAYIEYRPKYFKASSKIEKINMLNEFKNKCYAWELSGVDAFWASLNNNNSLSAVNHRLRSACDDYALSLQINDKSKYGLLVIKSSSTLSEYEQYISYYFPSSEYSALIDLYNVLNFNVSTLSVDNKASYKFLKNALAHGFEIEDFLIHKSIFYGNAIMSEDTAIRLLNDGYLLLDRSHETFYDGPYSETTMMTRRNFATMLNMVFNLDESFSATKINALKIKGSVLDGSVGWFYDALVLKYHGIANGQGIGAENQFRPDDNITMHELLVMLVNAMNYKKCGKSTCSLTDLVGVQQ